MKLDIFGDIQRIQHPENPEEATTLSSPHRIEVALVASDEQQYKVILLDADDSFDVIIHYPTGEREALWSLVK